MRLSIVAILSLVACSPGGSDAECPTDPHPCCCSGDVVDNPVCSEGKLSCGNGASLYFGDQCQCLADRDTACCLPHAFDTGTTSADTAATSDAASD